MIDDDVCFCSVLVVGGKRLFLSLATLVWVFSHEKGAVWAKLNEKKQKNNSRRCRLTQRPLRPPTHFCLCQWLSAGRPLKSHSVSQSEARLVVLAWS